MKQVKTSIQLFLLVAMVAFVTACSDGSNDNETSQDQFIGGTNDSSDNGNDNDSGDNDGNDGNDDNNGNDNNGGGSTDADGDGVHDSQDKCANTPQGESVDADGCADSQKDHDSDGDGVNDPDDKCPDTPAGVPVGADGCELPDGIGGTRAGASVVDASWQFGASAGQFSATGHGIDNGRGYDPYFHAVRKVGSDILGSRMTVRALVVEGENGRRVAIVANDLYLPNDILHRRVAQVLAEHDATVALSGGTPTGITVENLAMTVSHSHTSPFYSTPAPGPWIFQDVYDLRFYEYMARRQAQAIIQAIEDMRPVTVGGATTYANDIRSHTYGAKISTDSRTLGTPAGQPHDYTSRQMYVMRFDDAVTGNNYANWIVLGVHPEWVWGEEIMNGDVTHATMRVLDRETGAINIMSQSETGTSGPHKDTRAHDPQERREFQESNLAGTDRAARLVADNVHATLHNIAAGTPWDASQFMAMNGDAEVDFYFQRFAPQAPRIIPGASNCNTDKLYYEANPSVPVPELPECKTEFTDPVVEPFQEVSPIWLSDVTAPLADQLLELGVPLPVSYSIPSLALLEEQATVPIQAFRIGDAAITFCPCEQFTDTALNIISRLNAVAEDVHTGWDWDNGYPDDLKNPGNNGDFVHGPDEVGCTDNGDGTVNCPHPSRGNNSTLTVSKLSYDRMKAQIHNDAAGWDDFINYGVNSEAEPLEASEIKGNFTHEEYPATGYGFVVPVGMANDYWGYMPAYREYRAHDHYRKSLAGLGPHGADFLATRLARGAASLNGGHAAKELGPQDYLYLAEDGRAEVLALMLGITAQLATPVYEATLPADGGEVRIVEQPVDIRRFDAATIRWIGGSSYEGMPDVVVQHRTGGQWVDFANMEGDVQLHLRFPGAQTLFEVDDYVSLPEPGDLVTWRSGSFEWMWTATFEAFVSELPLAMLNVDGKPVQSFITPVGEYRFVINGVKRNVGATDDYQLISESFNVSPWGGITVSDASVAGNQLSFTLGPTTANTEFQQGADGGEVSVSPRLIGPIDYPDSYPGIDSDGTGAPIPWLRNIRNLHSYAGGQNEEFCHRCSFRPWADVSNLSSVTVLCDGESLKLTPSDGSAIQQSLDIGRSCDSLSIPVGGVLDSYGESNSVAINLSE